MHENLARAALRRLLRKLMGQAARELEAEALRLSLAAQEVRKWA